MINQICKEIFGQKFSFNVAFNHSSYANKFGLESNEKLEFLGDSIINFYVTNYVFNLEGNEGKLSTLRAKMVSTSFFEKVCDEIKLTKNLKIIGEISPKIKANLLEAVVAEVYLQLKEKSEIKRLIDFLIIKKFSAIGLEDYKTKLQELLQKNKHYQIVYKTKKEGAIFVSEVLNNGLLLSSGSGTSKKLAEKDAAKNALKKLEREGKKQ